MEYEFSGKHILTEFYEVSNFSHPIIDLETHVRECCERAEVTILKFDVVQFPNSAYTAYALLKESHLSIHTYPEHKSIFIDVFTCGKINNQIIVEALEEFYKPLKKEVKIIERGL